MADTLSSCITCRKRRRACSKELPRCGRCRKAQADCVFRLGGLTADAVPEAAAAEGAVGPDGTFVSAAILVNGAVRLWGDGFELRIEAQKRACQACHRSKRNCEGGVPCGRCAKAGIECVEWVPERRRGKAKARRRADLDTEDEESEVSDDPEPEAPPKQRRRSLVSTVAGRNNGRRPGIDQLNDMDMRGDDESTTDSGHAQPNGPSSGLLSLSDGYASSYGLSTLVSPAQGHMQLFPYGLETKSGPFAPQLASHQAFRAFQSFGNGGPVANGFGSHHVMGGFAPFGGPPHMLGDHLVFSRAMISEVDDNEPPDSPQDPSRPPPGTWDPPLSPPPRFVDRALAPFPQAHILPSAETVGSLIKTFWDSHHDVFHFLHPSTFPDQIRADRTLQASLCLAALHASEDPSIRRASADVQRRLLSQALDGVRSALDLYLPPGEPLPDDPRDDERMDHVCETLWAMAMLAYWATNSGQARLFKQLAHLIFSLGMRIGLHRDPMRPGYLYGRPTRREGWIRRQQRQILWFNICYQVFFSNHWTRSNLLPGILAHTRQFTIPLFIGSLFNRLSLEQAFDPEPFEPENMPYPPSLGRPAIYGDLISWMDLPRGSPEREALLSVVGEIISGTDQRYDTRYSYAIEFIHWNLRLDVDAFGRACEAAGTTPAEVASGARADPDLAARKVHLEAAIADLLAHLSPPVRAAEERGDYAGLLARYVKDDGTDPYHEAAHAQLMYLVAIRLMRLELRTSFGKYSFAEIAQGKMDAEFNSGELFRECLKDVVIFTRHMGSLLKTFKTIRFDVYHAGLLPPKIGALHIAMLLYMLRTQDPAQLDPEIVCGLHEDLDICAAVLAQFSGNGRSKVWQSMIRQVFDKQVAWLKGTEWYRGFFDRRKAAGAAPTEPPTDVEIEMVHLRKDVEEQGERWDAELLDSPGLDKEVGWWKTGG
ncbi:hypothetical protein DFJ74DRAFT_691079 [Hyaloraphidium curvatum]|nr:hypothetical protein DFJ74DRAFT_691079 [Hyaloraphidium curvatum]